MIISKIRTAFIWACTCSIVAGCYPSEELDVPVQEPDFVPTNELDLHIQENFIDEFNIAVRYRFVDDFLNIGWSSTPVREELVRPMLDIIQEYWVEPYLSVENGEEFFRKGVPKEIIMVGGVVLTPQGRLLGFAEAGASITLTEVNFLDLTNQDWLFTQLSTIFHEYAHIVDQNNGLPIGFEDISPEGITSAGSWFAITDEEALQRGFVRNYATSSITEDFAETIGQYTYRPDFFERFIDLEENCQDDDCRRRNEGRQKIQQKLDLIRTHYKNITGVDLDELRAAVIAKING